MQVNFAHICDYATLSREGKLSVLGIFSEMYSQAFPTTHPMMYLAYEVECSQSELGRPIKVEIRLADADGGIVLDISGEVMFAQGPNAPKGERLRTPQLVTFANIQLPKPSTYTFSIFVSGDLKKETSFKLGQIPEAGIPGFPPGGLRR